MKPRNYFQSTFHRSWFFIIYYASITKPFPGLIINPIFFVDVSTTGLYEHIIQYTVHIHKTYINTLRKLCMIGSLHSAPKNP